MCLSVSQSVCVCHCLSSLSPISAQVYSAHHNKPLDYWDSHMCPAKGKNQKYPLKESRRYVRTQYGTASQLDGFPRIDSMREGPCFIYEDLWRSSVAMIILLLLIIVIKLSLLLSIIVIISQCYYLLLLLIIIFIDYLRYSYPQLAIQDDGVGYGQVHRTHTKCR